MGKKLKKILIALILLLAVLFVISALSGKDETSNVDNSLSSTADSVSSATASSSGASDNGSGVDFASMLSSIKSINIDTSVFESPAYKALRDHPISLGTDVIGRSNPFAPIGSDSGELSINPIVQTLQPGKVTSTSAELSAQVSFSTTAPVSVVFQYGTSDTFGSATSPQALAKSGTAVATITGLASGTKYYVQAVAVVGSTTTTGNTMTFTTTTAPSTSQ